MRNKTLALGFTLLAAASAAACSSGFDLGGSSSGGEEAAPGTPTAPVQEGPVEDPKNPAKEALADPFATLPKGKAQTDTVCARGDNNRVTQALCSGRQLTGVSDLLSALNLSFGNPSGPNGRNGNPGFTLLGHSSSLIARNVSAVNPRAFVFTPAPGTPQRIPGYTIVAFTRGETFVEIAAEDPQKRKLSLYLLKFDLACEENHTCTPGDLFTPDVEKNWKGYTLYDDEDLKNSVLDCRHCHQPSAQFAMGLRMQELRDPWTHWFRNDRPGGVALFIDYLNVHQGEDYGGIPASIIQKSDPRALEDVVVGQGFEGQPNVFDSERIEEEVEDSASQQPVVNVPAGRSSAWQALYEGAVRGDHIPPPYHDVKVTDPEKLLFVSQAYVQLREGKRRGSELPDMRRVFLDEALADLSFIPKKGASGREVLMHACAQCHNPSLDQSISRAKFDVTKLDSMDKAMKAKAIARMKLSGSDILKMPPAMMRNLPDDALNAAIAELSK